MTIPDIIELFDEDKSAEELARHHDLVKQLEEVVMSWERHISKVIETQQAKANKHFRIFTALY